MNELKVTHEFNLVSNMKEVKASIAEIIAKYDVVVSEDKLPEAKDLMATFNKDKKEFSATCKKFIDAISEPITEFKAQQKEIEKMYDDGRAKIADQVAKFEANKLETIGVLVRAYRNMNCETRSISIDAVSVEDLVMLSAVSSNKKGYSLTSKTTASIDARIQAVENEILKARLAAEEKAKRDRDIADKARLEAEEKALQREIELLARAEREKAQAVECERVRVEREERAKFEQINNNLVDPTKEKNVLGVLNTSGVISDESYINQMGKIDTTELHPTRYDGKRVFTITAIFEILAPDRTPYERITAKFQSMIESAGITSLKSIEVM